MRVKGEQAGLGRNSEPIEPGAGTPLYREVRRRIVALLASGEWGAGDRLPAERELARRFGVAVSTVRAGIGDLCVAGVLIRRQGRGTFVARHDIPGQQFRYSNVYHAAGGKVATTRSIVAMRTVRADRATAAVFGMAPDTRARVHRIEAQLVADARVAALLELILPLPRFARLRRGDLDRATENLYAVYQRVCGVTVLRMEERVSARVADASLAEALRVPVGHPVLTVERIAFTFGNVPVEIRRRTYEGLTHHYLFVHDEIA